MGVSKSDLCAYEMKKKLFSEKNWGIFKINIIVCLTGVKIMASLFWMVLISNKFSTRANNKPPKELTDRYIVE